MKTPILIGGYNLTFTSSHLWLIVLAFLVTAGITLLYYRRTNPPLEFRRRLLLGILRGVAVAVLFFTIAEPLLVITRTKVADPTVAILIDNSSSMAENRNSREQFDNLEPLLSAIDSRVGTGTRTVRYALSDTVKAAGPVDGSANATAIGDGLEYLANDLRDQNLQAVVLVSDGVSNFGSNPATAAKSLGVPVYTVGVGSPEQLPDIRVVDVVNNPVGFADREFELEVVLESRGFENERVPVRVRNRDKTLAQQEIELLGEGRRQTAKISLMPPGEGTYTLEISVPAQENEQSRKNNSRQIQVKFRKSRIKILLAAAYLNWDFTFLKRAILAQADFDLDTYVSSPKRIEGTIPFPENLAALGEYDALILYDFDAIWMTEHRQLFDAFFDRTGTGMFIVAGENFAGKAQTDYTRQILPYSFVQARPVVVRQESTLMPTQEGRIHPILQLSEDPGKNADILNTLPPFTAHLDAGEAHSGAAVLAAIPSSVADAPETPVLAVQRYRTGKVALLSAFPFWKLDFLASGFNESDSSFVGIVENAVLWLVARDDLQRVSIMPQKPIFIAGETIDLSARVLDESYLPVADAEVEATLTSEETPGDTMVISFQPGRAGSYAASLNYIPPGNYRIDGAVTREGISLGKPRSSFVVEPYSLEDLSQISDFDMLKRMAEVSGGSFTTAADTTDLPILADLPEVTVSSTSELALFDYPVLLVIFIAAICAEWLIRRRHQLL